jgi:hypothetical protein
MFLCLIENEYLNILLVCEVVQYVKKYIIQAFLYKAVLFRIFLYILAVHHYILNYFK